MGTQSWQRPGPGKTIYYITIHIYSIILLLLLLLPLLLHYFITRNQSLWVPGGSMVARLRLKGVDGRAPPGVEPAYEGIMNRYKGIISKGITTKGIISRYRNYK